jgi:hypothetical protein
MKRSDQLVTALIDLVLLLIYGAAVCALVYGYSWALNNPALGAPV